MSLNSLKKILIYGDTNWSVGSVHKNIAKYLQNDFDFTFYDWADYTPEMIIPIIKDFDIVFTNYVALKRFYNPNITHISLNKFIFVAHGYPDIIGYSYNNILTKNDFPQDALYSVTSMSIAPLYPEGVKVYPTLNGVEMETFEYIERSGKIEKIGWCGAPAIVSKRFSWGLDIATKTNLLFSCAATLSFDELKKWYHKIDILIITAGPEEWVETGPLPPFEAIASGTLVIGTRVGNFKQLPGPKFDTIEEAITIIEELKQNPDMVKRIAREQYLCVKNNWSYENIHLQWKDVFLESLNRSQIQSQDNNIGINITEIIQPLPKICFITAIYGNYELSCKRFVDQTIKTDYICFTDNPNIITNGWSIDTTPYHIINKSKLDNDSYNNSLKNNQHTFNISKYYKQAFQNIPRLRDYDTIVWIDGTIEIVYNKTSEFILDHIEKANIITWHHEDRKGNLIEEVNASILCGRYTTTFWNNQIQPFQDVVGQYNEYIKNGYDELYYKDNNYHTEHMGVWLTCFIAFSNKDKNISNLLDMWYLQTLKYTTQDQISFPYVCQTLHFIPYTLPNHKISGDSPHDKTQLYIKHSHGL